jgi:DNA invertase Pin-like site-specific DNA recombinase
VDCGGPESSLKKSKALRKGFPLRNAGFMDSPKDDRQLALAYVRVSTDEQVTEGASLAGQLRALQEEAERRGWRCQVIQDKGVSARTMNRPGLSEALAMLDRGEADVLMAVRLDRVSRSVVDFASLLARAKKRGWRLVMLSPNLDTEDSAGKFTAHVLAAAAEYERDLIGVRTREGMAQRRREGVHVGRPRALPIEVVERIVSQRIAGQTLRQIAEGLTADDVPTARGGAVWGTSSIQAVLASTSARPLFPRGGAWDCCTNG